MRQMIDTGEEMSDELGSDLGNETTPKALRDAHDALKAQNAELLNRLAALDAKDRTNQLTELFKAKTDRVGLVKFYPQDAEVSADKVTAWMTENAEILGIDVSPETGSQAALREQIARSGQATDNDPSGALGLNRPLEVGTPEEVAHLYATLSHAQLIERGLLQARPTR